MEVAETDFMRSHGLSVSWLEPDGKRVGFPRVSATCDYARPAQFGEVLTITVVVEKVGRKSVTYRHDFTNKDGAFVAVGRITAVFCREAGEDYGFESVEIPPDLRTILES
jgi:acyl-CoA thioester hydrolase